MTIPVLQHPKLGKTVAPSPSVIDERGRLPTRPMSWETAGYPYRSRAIAGVTVARIHYTAGGVSSTTLDIAAYQVGPGSHERFPAIAYHYLIEGDGSVHWCHDLDKRVWGSGAAGSNEQDVHICYTGDREPNGPQLRGIQNAIRHAQNALGRSLTVAGHKDNYSTSCPGPMWPQWRAAVLP
jgi:N-acetylmuramoyl-L-alanine amidase